MPFIPESACHQPDLCLSSIHHFKQDSVASNLSYLGAFYFLRFTEADGDAGRVFCKQDSRTLEISEDERPHQIERRKPNRALGKSDRTGPDRPTQPVETCSPKRVQTGTFGQTTHSKPLMSRTGVHPAFDGQPASLRAQLPRSRVRARPTGHCILPGRRTSLRSPSFSPPRENEARPAQISCTSPVICRSRSTSSGIGKLSAELDSRPKLATNL